MPLVLQQPRIGDVAVHARRKHEKEQSHLVAFATEILARQAVAKLVDHFDHSQDGPHVEDVAPVEERMERGQAGAELVVVTENPECRRKPTQNGQYHHRAGVQPPEVRQHAGQQPFRINDGDFDVEDVRPGG